jgi:hypothetical protein
VEVSDLTPVAFVVADQNFPPSLPVEEEECMKIIRIEDASPQELALACLEVTRGFIVPAGSVVVLSSASYRYLAWVGTATYANDFVAARQKLLAAFRGGIEVVHGVPVLRGGVLDTAGAFALRDNFNWLTHLQQGRDISDTRAHFNTTLACVTTGGLSLTPPVAAGSSSTPAAGPASPLAAVAYHQMLPSSFDKKDQVVFKFEHISGGYQIAAVTHDGAVTLLDFLKNELNDKYMCELGEIVLSEGKEYNELYDSASEQDEGPRMIYIGGSHAARQAAAVELGTDCVSLAKPGFCVTEATINHTVNQLTDELSKSTKRIVVVFHLFDNNVFFVSKGDGSRTLPVRGQDGTYHVPGKLEFADHHVIKNLVTTATPLLRAAGDCEKIILSPLPRYLKKCCDSADHLTNTRDKRKYCRTMGEAISDMKESIRDLVFGKKIRSFKVLSSLLLLADDEDPNTYNNLKFFQEDPVLWLSKATLSWWRPL